MYSPPRRKQKRVMIQNQSTKASFSIGVGANQVLTIGIYEMVGTYK